MEFLYFAVGLFLLFYGSSYIIDSSLAVAHKYSLNSVIVGLTLVALGTSAPELAINISSNLKGVYDVAFSDVIGSSIFNNLLVLGSVLCFRPIVVNPRLLAREIPFGLVSGLMLFILANDSLFNSVSTNVLSTGDGMIFLLVFAVFLWILATYKEGFFETQYTTPKFGLVKATVLFVAGVALLGAGAHMLIDSVIALSDKLGVSHKFLGVSMVAFSTSAPELMTAYLAVKRDEVALVFGNIIGSNIFNVLFILGVSTMFGGMVFNAPALNLDLIFLILIKLLLLVSIIFAAKKFHLSKKTGFLFLALFVSYLAYLGYTLGI